MLIHTVPHRLVDASRLASARRWRTHAELLRDSAEVPALTTGQRTTSRHGIAQSTPLTPIRAHRHRATAVGCRDRATSASAPESSKPHNAALVARGFVHGRLSDAGPALLARPALAGVRNPSPSQTLSRLSPRPESGHGFSNP